MGKKSKTQLHGDSQRNIDVVEEKVWKQIFQANVCVCV